MKLLFLIITCLVITACHSKEQSENSARDTAIATNSNTEGSKSNQKDAKDNPNVFGDVFVKESCGVNKVMPSGKEDACDAKQLVSAKLFVEQTSQPVIQLESNTNGQFSLFLPPGKYSIRAEMKPLAKSETIAFTVKEKSNVQLSIELRLKHMPR